MRATTWTCFDFGSAYIRVARAVAVSDPAAVVPQTVQFDGLPALRNLAYLSDDGRLLEVGDAVLRLAPTQVDVVQLRWGAALGADAESEPSEAADLLLTHIVATLARDHGFRRNNAGEAGLIATPIIADDNQTAAAVARLRSAGFAVAIPANSALAAVAYYSSGHPVPGQYGVIDVGASRTRLAVVACRQGEPPAVVACDHSRPGGDDFDEVLLAHFARQLPPLVHPVDSLARRAAIEEFKRHFAEAWADGHAEYSALAEIGSERLPLSLDRATFGAPQVAGPLMDDFRTAAEAFFGRHAPRDHAAGDLSAEPLRALLLVGGGARWPFVQEWAVGYMGADGVQRDPYPERTVAMGLPRLAAWLAAAAPAQPAAPPAESRPERAPAASPPLPRRMAPGRAALLEFVAGLVGILGAGWFVGVRQVAVGCVVLLAWWAVLVLLLALGAVSTVANRPQLLIPLLVVWLGVPALSAALVYRRLSRASE